MNMASGGAAGAGSLTFVCVLGSCWLKLLHLPLCQMRRPTAPVTGTIGRFCNRTKQYHTHASCQTAGIHSTMHGHGWQQMWARPAGTASSAVGAHDLTWPNPPMPSSCVVTAILLMCHGSPLSYCVGLMDCLSKTVKHGGVMSLYNGFGVSVQVGDTPPCIAPGTVGHWQLPAQRNQLLAGSASVQTAERLGASGLGRCQATAHASKCC